LVELKQKNPGIKTLISVGGWTLSDPFSQMAADPFSRQNFIQQVISFCDQYQFDGIDLDWEYPGFAEHSGRPEDKQNFTILLKDLYAEAKNHKPPLLVTIAAPTSPSHYNNIEADQIHHYLDWINIMAYDFYGAWKGGEDSVTNHQTPLYSTQIGNPQFNADSAVNFYLSQGVPEGKLVLGLPLYGRSYAGVSPSVDGLFQDNGCCFESSYTSFPAQWEPGHLNH
jgi:chitinase